MLPSTGYFKAINCPFYESGTCDRPYCHFKHSKREDVGITTEAIETVENRSTGQVEESKSATMVISDFYLKFYNKNYKKLSKKILINHLHRCR